jgi:hypothetical protein
MFCLEGGEPVLPMPPFCSEFMFRLAKALVKPLLTGPLGALVGGVPRICAAPGRWSVKAGDNEPGCGEGGREVASR